MSFYGDMAETVNDLLSELGQAVTMRRQTAGEYDPETGSAAITTTDEAGYGAVFDFGGRASAYFSGETMILAGDKQLLLSPVGISAPLPGHLAIVGNETWNIVSVKTTAPAGEAVMYECLIRK